MPEIPRLNGVIKALEEGKTTFVGFAPVDIETTSALANSSYDGDVPRAGRTKRGERHAQPSRALSVSVRS